MPRIITNSTAIAAIAIQAPLANLVISTTTQHRAGHRGADGVDRAAAHHPGPDPAVRSVLQQPVPVPDHADLAGREGHEDPDDVELDQPGRLGVEGDDQDDRRAGQDDDPVAEGEPVAAGVQLARQEAVPGQDRGQHREAVERRVGGQDQDDPGRGDGEVERRREVREDRVGQLADDRLLVVLTAVRQPRRARAGLDQVLAVEHQPVHVDVRVDVAQVGQVGQGDDADQHRDRDGAHQQQRGRGVLALGLLEGRHAVADRLDTGQRRAAGGEGPQDQEARRPRCRGRGRSSGRW